MSLLLLLQGTATPSVTGTVAVTLANATSTASGYQVFPLNETFPGASGAPAVWWTTSVVGTGTIGLDTNRLKVVLPALSDAAQALLVDHLPADAELRASYTFGTNTPENAAFCFRGDGVWQSSGNTHLFTNGLSLNPLTNVDQVRLYSTVASTSTQLGVVSLTIGATDTVNFHVIVNEGTILWRAWIQGTSEPSVWQSAADTNHTARRRLGLGVQNPSASNPFTGYWDNVTADSAVVSGSVARTLGNVTSAASGAFGPTGTVAQTLGNTTSAASGNSVVGTVARSLANATVAASGGSSTSGSVAQTLGNTTASATGTHGVTGTAAVTLANTTAAASGSTGGSGIVGSLAVTLASVTVNSPLTDDLGNIITDDLGNPIYILGAEGSHGIGGTVARTLANIVSAAIGTATNNVGSLAVTLDDTTSTATGASGAAGTVARTLQAATTTATGTVGVTGSLAVTLGAVTSAASGTATSTTVAGNLSVTLAPVTSTATGSSVGGDVAVTLGDATVAASGTAGPLGVSGTVAVTLAPVISTAAGYPTVIGELDRTLANVVSDGLGSSVSGTVDVTLEDITSTTQGAVTVTVFATGTIHAVYQTGRIESIYQTGRLVAVAGAEH